MRRGRLARGSQKETSLPYTKTLHPESRGRHVQEAALRACLEGQADKTASAWRSPRVGNGQSRSGRGLSLRKYKDGVGDGSCLSQRQVFSRGPYRKILPHFGEFRPLQRSTRRCPPWTRTGLMSGDRKATRYWALGFGHGAAPAGASDSPVRQRPENPPWHLPLTCGTCLQ
jgi:hypothetical protein